MSFKGTGVTGPTTTAPALSNKIPPHVQLHLQRLQTTLESKKAQDITIINLNGKSTLADALIIATGTSTRHLAALATLAEEAGLTLGYQPHLEGIPQSDWQIVDLGDIIIHLFTPEARLTYKLDKMWSIQFSNDDSNLAIAS